MSRILTRYLAAKRGRATKVADAVGISRGYLSNIASGLKTPATDKLVALSLATGIPIGALISDDAPVELVPVVSWVSAGPLLSAEPAEINEDNETIVVSGLGSGDWVGFRVEGDSMDRISPPGSLILVNRRERALIANACYVFVDADGTATYKRFRPDPFRLEPVTTDPDRHQTIYPTNTPAVIGRVRRSMLEM